MNKNTILNKTKKSKLSILVLENNVNKLENKRETILVKIIRENFIINEARLLSDKKRQKISDKLSKD